MVTVARRNKIKVPYGDAKLQVVCTACNNGWMSDFQRSVKENLTSCILGRPLVLDVPAKIAIRDWAIMTTIVSEFADTGTIGVAPLERSRFYKERQANEHWGVWIGNYLGNEMRYHHWGGTFAKPPDRQTVVGSIQGSTYTWGELFIHTFYCTDAVRAKDLYEIFKGAKYLVPITDPTASTEWPPYLPLGTDLARKIAYFHYENFQAYDAVELVRSGEKVSPEFEDQMLDSVFGLANKF